MVPRSSFFAVRVLPVFLVLAMAGCSRFRPGPPTEYVYVVAKETFLRDRVAAVSNRVGNVVNGQRLEVVEHGRRFLKVKTDKGEIGWIEEHGVVNQDIYNQFQELSKQHANDPVITTAVLRDDLYLHIKPGRKEERFYLLPENDKLQLLVRASVPKPAPPQGFPVPVVRPLRKKKMKPGAPAPKPVAPGTPETPPPPPMEDWWLIRDSQGKVGWMLSRRLDMDVPDAIAGYSEGQRVIGAYKLTTVYDPESNFPNGQAPEYLTVTSPYHDGLPYDFDQVRVFTWNTRKHRYEGAFRQHDLQGYLPVKVGTQAFDKIGTVPVFSFKNSTDEALAIDPATGTAHPTHLETLTYRMEGAIVRKVEPPAPPPAVGAPPAAASTSAPQVAPAPAAKSKAKRKSVRRVRRHVAAHEVRRHKHKK